VPKRDRTEHDATIALEFAPLHEATMSEAIPNASAIDELWLRFEDFPVLRITRRLPISGNGSALTEVDAFLIEHEPRGWAVTFGGVGLLGFAIFSASSARRARRYWRFRRFPQEIESPKIVGVVAKEGMRVQKANAKPAVPATWDPEGLTFQIRSLQQQPNVLSVFVEGVITRFIIGQDRRVAKKRTEFLRAKLDELKVLKEIQGLLDDHSLREKTLEIRNLE